MPESRSALNTDKLNAYVAATLARAPKVTDQKREELTRALRPGTRKGHR
ncbi:hypothetical protein M3C58_00415 [Brachybacterium muris]|nr:hypothetical protein [Brachybacterium muris]MCT1653662.1 hypothetical protein [Brachybacterium muris]MCT1996681.1 hypothetical protein [Brachybacterium muris]